MIWGGSIDNAGVNASITVTKWSMVCYTKHCGSIRWAGDLQISIPESNSSAITEEPIWWSISRIFGSADNSDSAPSVWTQDYSILPVAKESKSWYHRIKPCGEKIVISSCLLLIWISACIHISKHAYFGEILSLHSKGHYIFLLNVAVVRVLLRGPSPTLV